MMPVPDTFKRDAYGHTAVIGKALRHGARIRLLELLTQAPRCVQELAREVGHSLANTSQHLQVLKRAGLVVGDRDGKRIVYRIADPSVEELVEALSKVAFARSPALRALTEEVFADRDGAEPVSEAALAARMARGDVTLVDVRPAEEYAAGHLPGAISIPIDSLPDRLGELPRERDVVAYCRGPLCLYAADAARLLREQGFTAARSETTAAAWRRRHWEGVHGRKAPGEVSWFQAHPSASLEFIGAADPSERGSVIDVGGGVSRLVDALLTTGRSATVVDTSAASLEHSRARLGEDADRASWIVADVLHGDLGGPFDVWHDRAVFHFLVDPADRLRYRRQLRRTLARDGAVVLSAFADDGPAQCSGLPVQRWTEAALAAEFEGFSLDRATRHVHTTPWGAEQRFVTVLLRRSLE